MLYPVLKDLVQLRKIISSRTMAYEYGVDRSFGNYSSLFHGLGLEFETVRPYVVGDDVRYIDWRVTARIGKPHVKTFRAESDRNVLLVVDANAYMRFGTRNTFKSCQAANICALLCWKSLQQQDRIGGLLFGDIERGMQYYKPAKTESSVLNMLKGLCDTRQDINPPIALSQALQHLVRVATPQSLVFIISDFSMEPIENIYQSLLALRRKSQVILVPIHDPADSDIPALGMLNFSNGQQKILLDTDNLQARKKYKLAWDEYQVRLESLAKKLKSPLLWIATNCDPAKTLFANTGSVLAWKT